MQLDVFARLSHALSLVGSYITRRAAERHLEGLSNLLVDPARDREAIDAHHAPRLVLAWDYHGATTLSRLRMRDGSIGFLVERRQVRRPVPSRRFFCFTLDGRCSVGLAAAAARFRRDGAR